MNELAIIFDKIDLDTNEVLRCSSTKWNFLPFSPGLVGGHCIGVDPYYLTYKAMQIGYPQKLSLRAEKINDSMGNFIVDKLILDLNIIGKSIQNAKIGIFGLTFKKIAQI